MARISQRISAVAESATLAIDAKAKALVAAGEDVIGFGAGEPDFPTPAHIVAAAIAACSDPRNHKYTPAGGLPELKEAVAAKTARDSGYRVAASQVLITNGGKQAVEETFATLLDPGDEVLLPAPYWTTYPEVIRLAGGVPVEVPTTWEAGFKVTVDQLESARTARTKVLLFVSPSNPTGAVYAPEEVEAIGRWAVDERLVGRHRRDLRAPGLRRRPVLLDAGARSRPGRHLRGHQRGGQDLRHDRLAGGLDDRPCRRDRGRGQPAVARHLQRVQRRPAGRPGRRERGPRGRGRDAGDVRPAPPHDRRHAQRHPRRALPRAAGRVLRLPERGGPAGAAARRPGGVDLAGAGRARARRAQVAFVPGEAFGAPGYARFSYALGDEALVEGITRLAKFVAG